MKNRFRAFDEIYKEMRYSDTHDGEFYINTKGVLYMYKIPDSEKYYKTYSVMQYVGITDANGRRIYEGDIVQLMYGDKYRVCFAGGCFMMNRIPDSSSQKFIDGDNVRIIGNIYENKDLLENAN